MNARTLRDYASDQKLLELSAKAAGIRGRYMDSQFVLEHPVTVDGCKRYLWRPLHDDGDALRLAVKLDLTIYRPGSDPAARRWTDFEIVFHEADCVRRAIVCAAAEIGKAMQEKH